MNDNDLQVLLDQPFVLVGVNYRLGPLGWLSLGCKEAPGNLGLWDQQLALRWVQDHISAFGGDPSSVTLMGESAGAMSAMLHMAAPSSANLFHRVVALSGTPSNPLLHQSRKPAAYARAFAKRLGCQEGADDETVLKFLQSLTAKQILKNGLIFKDWDNTAPMPWVPIDDSHLKEDAFLPLNFYDAVKAGKIAKVPVIMGCCKDEGLILSAPFQRYKRQLDILNRYLIDRLLFQTEQLNVFPSTGTGKLGLHYFSLGERGSWLATRRRRSSGAISVLSLSTLHPYCSVDVITVLGVDDLSQGGEREILAVKSRWQCFF